jgi:hypothetical protein
MVKKQTRPYLEERSDEAFFASFAAYVFTNQ